MSKRAYLVDGDVIPISPTIATLYDVNTAAFLQQLHMLVTSVERTERAYNFMKGRWWVYYTYEEWAEKFLPWTSAATIRRIIGTLEEDKIVISSTDPRKPTDRTKWYAIDYPALREKCEMADSKVADCDDASVQIEQMVEALNLSSSNQPNRADVYITTSNNDNNDKNTVAPKSATPRAPKATSKAKEPSRLARPVSVPTNRITPEAARIAALPPVSFDDFGGMTDSIADISVTDGLFNAVSELFGVTDVEKKLNSAAGLMVGMLRGNSNLKGEWGQNAMPDSMPVTGADLRAWASWWQEQPKNVGLTLPRKPTTLPPALQTWISQGKPLSYADKDKQRALKQSALPVVEEMPELTPQERAEMSASLRSFLKDRKKASDE